MNRMGLWLAVLIVAAPFAATCTAGDTPRTTDTPRMTVVAGKDVSGSILKKLGLPSRQYCWDACLKEDRCSGVRWGVVKGDTAGLCLLLTGPLTVKAPVTPKTDDGKPIQVTCARKEGS